MYNPLLVLAGAVLLVILFVSFVLHTIQICGFKEAFQIFGWALSAAALLFLAIGLLDYGFTGNLDIFKKMTHVQQIVAFEHEIQNVVDRFTHEFQLPVSSAIGVLMLQVRKIEDAILEENEE
jgi:NADH:ubiquinone oxidoreductase subunit 6 (subunit J)